MTIKNTCDTTLFVRRCFFQLHLFQGNIMARQTKENTEQTRLNIINAGLNTFLQKGYSKTTLQDIATAAGVTRGAVYWHFKNKKDVFYAVAHVAFEPLDFFWEEQLNSIDDPSDWIRNLLSRWMHELTHNTMLENAVRLILQQTEQSSELEEFFATDLKDSRDCIEQIARVVQLGIDENKFDEQLDPLTTAATVWAQICGYALAYIDFPDLVDWEQAANLQMNSYLQGLLKT
ncbi:TetR family transcriptional regulator [Halodesulfovibrio spirochaetisodalis]|uniref:TetR family transcriptional regulator n=1 Tax=Halodesulfovibrio spirochaetisodalis TaxID=1560234 RepID=UPI00083021AB|nr:TetR family transcriptional regulator [Halodesulfovibrio spirochaetisodalis]